MGTRSRIGILNADGTIKSVYCHWDGYPEWNGIKLRDYYSTRGDEIDLSKVGDEE